MSRIHKGLKLLRLLNFALIILFTGGCSSKLPYVNLEKVPENKAAIYVYVPDISSLQIGRFGVPVTATSEDGNKTYLGFVGKNRYVEYIVNTGKIKLSNFDETFYGNNKFNDAMVESAKKFTINTYKEVNINAESGKKYCIKAEPFWMLLPIPATYGGVFEEEAFDKCSLELMKTFRN